MAVELSHQGDGRSDLGDGRPDLGDDRARRGIAEVALGDGRPLIGLTGLCLVLSGGFALFQSATGHFLPHDVEFLEMTVRELCTVSDCRIVHFMFHDRVSFGGVLIAIGALYWWLAEFPLRRGEAWAWWTLCLSGLCGFASFLTYLGYGYLDSWHGIATLTLLPCFIVGMVKTFRGLPSRDSIFCVLRPGVAPRWLSPSGVGRACLLAAECGIVASGVTIMTVGMTAVFVPQDLAFIDMSREQIDAINPRLIPLIAHDRAGFGGGLCSGGIALLLSTWCARPSTNLWQILCLAGGVGFTAAIVVHPVIGYTDFIHLAPACIGAGLFALGLILTLRPMTRGMPSGQ